MIAPQTVQHLKQSSDFAELEKHIMDSVDELSFIDDIDFTDKEKAAIEGHARKLARQKLMKILEPFYTSSQPATDKIEITKRRSGIE